MTNSNHTTKKFPADRIIGLSAMLISLMTMILFAYQTEIIRVQSRLSVTPRLSFSGEERGQDSLVYFKMAIINKGLGPAIIDSIHIMFKGQKYPLDFGHFIQENYPDIEKYGNLDLNTSLGIGETLLPNEKIYLFVFSTKVTQKKT